MRLHSLIAVSALLLASAARSQETPPLDAFFPNLTPRAVGPTIMSGRISDLAVYEKEPRIFYVATSSGGLWKTVNAGTTFTPVFEREGSVSLGAVAVAAQNPDIVYVGTGEASSRNSVAWGDGVYRSDDGGKTWRHLGLKESRHIGKIVVHPTNPDVAFVAALGRLWGPNPERGVYRTTDGGKTWEHVLKVDDRTGAVDLQMDPKNPNNLLCAMWQRTRSAYDFASGGPGSGIYRSTDGGKNWSRVVRGLPTDGPLGRIGLSYFRSDPRIVVASIEYKAPAAPAAPATPPATPPANPPAAQPGTPPAAQPGGQRTTPARPSAQAPRFNGGGVFRSEDGGASWKQVGTLNPRPFYFSMPRQDPLDANRVYLPAISLHASDDAGKTFKALPLSVHVDFHAMWINPNDSNHLIVGNDGGVAQSHDRGATWDHFTSIAVGQFYAVAFDYQRPYWVYGGLQDNGSWGMPTQTRRGGPAFWDAMNVAGGDGFHVQVDPTDPNTVYAESQGGAIQRLDRKTGQSRFIRPRAPQGEAQRFNWSTPFILSPHNPRTLYLGGNRLYKSVNRGDAWQPVSPDLTTNDPAKLKPGRLSVTPEDTGAERHCTIITISESPMKAGLLYVGTDDGLVHTSVDDGKTWTNLTANIPDLPANTWCSRVLASKWVEGRVYATFDGHRSNDFRPYVYVSEDYGKTWKPLHGSLPEDDCVYVVREGERNPDLLFLGSEMSLRISLDRGATWHRFRNGFPTVAVHDLLVHPREGDLIIGTHGRAIWTLDVNGLEALTPEAMKADAAVFRPQDVLMLGFVDSIGGIGDRHFVARNTQPGTQIPYYLRTDVKEASLTISDVSGQRTQSLTAGTKAGLNMVRWNGRLGGRAVEAGEYRVTLKADGKEYTSSVRVVAAD